MKGSTLIIPFSVLAHLFIINLTLFTLTPRTFYSSEGFISTNAAWLFIALCLNFYTIARKERFITTFHKFLRHYFIFCLAYFTILAFRGIPFSPNFQLFVLITLLVLLSSYRLFFFYIRKRYRIGGGNYVNVVVVGKDKNLKKMLRVFNEPDYGYRYKGYFHDEKSGTDKYLGCINSCYEYILQNNIDEIYCLVSQLSSTQLRDLIVFADNNLKKLKIIPDNKGIFTRAMDVELFGTIPVLNLRISPLERNYARYGKRIFDIVFSSVTIIFILSWLIPLLYLANCMESMGPVFFRQLRHGYYKKSFWCYKFRSMKVNMEANTKMCTRNDTRITKIGRILRKTSIDELPQFINVFLGEMSVVGPRPHMEAHTLEYEKSVDKYLVRHYAKPGITGLAQVKGYRGEIVKKSDIINRTRMDIFYLEKWSPLLDLKIIYYTLYNSFKGEEKAY